MSGERRRIDVDVAIVGAGIAGLWLGNLFAQRGLSLAICESSAIGGTQTAASQGVVHGGLKYALGGAPTRASELLAPMPARWRTCLAGEGEVDLRGVPLLAEHMLLFAPCAGPEALAFFAEHLAAGRCRHLDAEATPPYLRGKLAALDDFVLSVPALIRRLAEPLRQRMIPATVTPEALVTDSQGVAAIETNEVHIGARAFVFAAGDGNQALAARAGFRDVEVARRPLRQTSVHLPLRRPVFAHCLQERLGAAPAMTITSHGDAMYVGGKVAEDGAGRSHAEQVAVIRRLLTRFFPAIDCSTARFETQRFVRAEPAQRGDDTLAARHGNCLLCWPLKLSLAPRLGDVAMALLGDIRPRSNAWAGHRTPAKLPWAQPPYAKPPC